MDCLFNCACRGTTCMNANCLYFLHSEMKRFLILEIKAGYLPTLSTSVGLYDLLLFNSTRVYPCVCEGESAGDETERLLRKVIS